MHAWAEVCHLLQSSKSPLTGFLSSIGWRITGFLQTLPAHSISNSAILHNNYISLLTREEKMAWRENGVWSSSVSGSSRLVWLQAWKKAMGWCTAQWKMLLICAETIVKESRKFELARLKKKKKKEKHFGRLGSVLSRCFLAPQGVLFVIKNTRRWTVGCYNGL